MRSLLYILVCVLLSVDSYGQKKESVPESLLGNRTYELLGRQSKQLSLRKSKLENNLFLTKRNHSENPTDSLSQRILDLEYQLFEIGKTIFNTQEKITTLEENWAFENTAQQEVIVSKQPANIKANKSSEKATSLLSSKFFSNVLSKKEYEKLLSAQQKEQEAIDLIFSFEDFIQTVSTAVSEYNNAVDVESSNQAYKVVFKKRDELKEIADKAISVWDSAFETKIHIYTQVCKKQKWTKLLDEINDSVEELEHIKISGKYTHEGVAFYPYSKLFLLEYEIKIAKLLSLTNVISLLEAKKESIVPDYYRFNNIRSANRANVAFEDISILPRPKHRSSSRIPKIVIPKSGDVYTIKLGAYDQLPNIKVFKNVSPLSKEQRIDRHTYIYVGLFPTLGATVDAVQKLRNLGFKKPEVVMWRNGVRRDDFVDRRNVEQTKITLYRIEIGGGRTLPKSVQDVMKEGSIRKEISKFVDSKGNTIFTLGTFDEKTEAETIVKAIKNKDKKLIINIIKIIK